MGQIKDGILLIDKEAGETSFGVVRKVKRALGASREWKVGHAGTLDPFATGLLIILLGQGTKLSPFLMSGTKRYRATVRLGIETDTLDPTGEVTRTATVPGLEASVIEQAAQRLIGTIEQTPPIYSAVRHAGKRAYRLAREGVRVDLKKRKVEVHALKIVSVDLPHLTMEVTCSGGTYIRSLAADLGTCLGTGAHLRALRRLASGPFHVRDALGSEGITREGGLSGIRDRVISLGEALPGMAEIHVGRPLARKVRQGYQPAWNEIEPRPGTSGDEQIKMMSEGDLVAILGIVRDEINGRGKVKIERVFT
jgi:tRNA pseudouridine55 synthase